MLPRHLRVVHITTLCRRHNIERNGIMYNHYYYWRENKTAGQSVVGGPVVLRVRPLCRKTKRREKKKDTRERKNERRRKTENNKISISHRRR